MNARFLRPLAGLILAAGLSLPAVAAPDLTMEQIMAHPDWIARSPEQPYFSADGKQIFFQQKAAGSELRDLYRISVAGGSPTLLSPAELVLAETDDRIFSADRKLVAWIRSGNLFVQQGSKRRQLLATGDAGELLTFVGNEAVALRDDNRVLLIQLADGSQRLLATLKTDDDPDADKDVYLELRAGAGGDEAALFLGEIVRVSSRFHRPAAER